jgi:hypothetical protein
VVSFHSAHKSGSVVSERSAPCHFFNACPRRGQGIESWVSSLFLLRTTCSRTPKKPSMEGENKYDGTRDPFKMFLEESLERQRNEMMDNFAQILRRLPTSDTSTSRGNRGIHIIFICTHLGFL